MKIVICLKQVPDTNTRLTLLPEGKGIDESSIEWIINPYDEFALEEALRIKEKKQDNHVTVLSVGPSRVEKALRTALAMGADKAVLLETDHTLNPTMISLILADFLKKESPDLILTGKSGIDNNHSLTGPMLAEHLQINQVSFINYMEEIQDGSWLCKRNINNGIKQEIQLKIPFLATVDKGINQPRYPSLPGIMKAKKKPIDKIPASLPTNKDIKLHSYYLPDRKITPHIFSGTPQEQVDQLMEVLKNKEKVLNNA